MLVGGVFFGKTTNYLWFSLPPIFFLRVLRVLRGKFKRR